MVKTLITLLASALIAFSPVTVTADEADMKAQVEEIAGGLVKRLPLDQKIVLKALSPEESGLPEDFLRKLSSDLEAALLVASDFEINLANRLTTEDLWSEAVEFGDADFEELYAASQADVMLMLAPRATGAGVEISVTAYRLLGEDAGQVIASSGSVVLAIDMENSLGVDVNSLNDQMAQVLQEIEKVGQTGGLISDPNTYAEYYHNARILQQRGEVDLAMRNYEMLFKDDLIFLDTALDFSDLLVARYGEAGAKKYISNRLVGSVSAIAELIFANLLADTLPVPDYSHLDQRDRMLAWGSWLLSVGEKGLYCRHLSVCVSVRTGYFYLASKSTADIGSIYIDDIKSLQLMEDIPRPIDAFKSNFNNYRNSSGVLPATFLVKPSEDELSMTIWKAIVPQLMYQDVKAEICFEFGDGTSNCENIERSSGLAIQKAQSGTDEIGIIVSPPARTSNIRSEIVCITSVRVTGEPIVEMDLPILIMAPSYPKKAFNKSEFYFIERLQQCERPVELVRDDVF